MAKLLDKQPHYEGEKYVWDAFGGQLPSDWVVYNNRSVNGREYDFCILAPSIGLFIVEVKGWQPVHILTVVDQNTILLVGKENPEGSPRNQARGYRFDLLQKIRQELGMNPLVMSLVCYPFISKQEYFAHGLNVVSEVSETIIADDFRNQEALQQKFMQRYHIDQNIKHDTLDAKRLALIRHHFEPNYDLKQDKKILNPGYSRLRIITHEIDAQQANIIVAEYFSGIKEIIFVPSDQSRQILLDTLDEYFSARNIHPFEGDLAVGKPSGPFLVRGDHFAIFNFEIEVIGNLREIVAQDIVIEEGVYDDDIRSVLCKLSQISSYNFQQYEIEHAPCDKNILVTAGAGTGKTYSMVSRVAFLCNKTTDAIVDLVAHIVMITFTNDAADHMKVRLKAMFMNYFILTGNEKYMHMIEAMNQLQVSTIHKFAIQLLQQNCMYMGMGYDSQITNETYQRGMLYHHYLDEFIRAKNEANPDFSQQLPIPAYQLEDLLLSFSEQLYSQSVDIKELSPQKWGAPPNILPFFNELIEQVMVKAEKDYAALLQTSNLLSLKACMIQMHHFVQQHALRKGKNQYKYIFIDEFQDTDHVQIDTIVNLQHLFGPQCHLFLVGDLKQSIYRFRGVSLSAFDQVVAVDGVKTWMFYSLTRNYRTDCRLLNKFHSIFTDLGLHKWLPYDQKCDRLTSQLVKEYATDELVRRVDTHTRNQKKFQRDLVGEIRYQIQQLNKLSQQKKLSPAERTIAVLVRYNRQIQDVVSSAAQEGITVQVSQGGDLYQLPSTRDLYKLMLAITHPQDVADLANLIMSNYVSLSIDLSSISGKNMDEKRTELVHLLDEYFMLCLGKTWAQLIVDFATRPILVVLRDIYEEVKPWSHFKDEAAQLAYRQNYECLIEKLVGRYAREYLTSNKILTFLEINITTYQEEASRRVTHIDDGIRVVCTTVHKAKGLEYGTVILPFTNDDLTKINRGLLNVHYYDGKVSYRINLGQYEPISNGVFDEELEIREQIQEEFRILYVAMTRAIRNFVWFHDLDSAREICWANELGAAE